MIFKSEDENDTEHFWRGVFILPRNDKIIFSKIIKLSLNKLPTWKPCIRIDERYLAEVRFRLPGNAVQLLKSLHQGSDNNLVFPAPEGGYIRADNFAKRQWRPILESLGIDYRRPYTTRHTMTSHSLNHGQDVVELAGILGNSPRTIYQSYAGQIGEAKPRDLF